jgi:hypothetical protein
VPNPQAGPTYTRHGVLADKTGVVTNNSTYHEGNPLAAPCMRNRTIVPHYRIVKATTNCPTDD